MFANTALGVVLIGGSLLLLPQNNGRSWRRASAQFLALAAATLGGLTLFEHLTDYDLGIDTLIANRPWGQQQSAAPMRMGLPASTSLLVLGIALLLSMRGAPARKVASMLALGVMAIVSLSLIGYWYNADQLYVLPRFTGIAWQSSITLAILGVGLIAAIPEFGLIAILRRDDAGGVIVCGLMLPIIGLPLLLGWTRILGQNAGLYDMAFGTAVRTLVEIILLAGLLWWTADGISRQAMLARTAESALRESEQRFRLMADAAPVLIWVTDTEKRGTWFNKQWLSFVGRPMERELGHGWTESIHEDDLNRTIQTYVTAFDAREPFSLEFRLRRHDGEFRWLQDAGVPRYDSAGRFAGYIGSCMDITDRKQTEEATKEAAHRKDEFLATLAHELRNPLAPIGNALQIIKYADGQPGAVESARTTMERQFGQMVRLVDDLLDIGRITRDKLELRPQRTELDSIIHQAVESSRPLAEAGRHKLMVNLPADKVWVHGDPVRLAQVFSNLLNNACKFTEPGGEVTITATRDDDQVAVTVSDTGIGLAPIQLESIFDMFSQVDQSLERTRSGLGIGLTLVKRLVELHDGTIIAHSAGLGQGSILRCGCRPYTTALRKRNQSQYLTP